MAQPPVTRVIKALEDSLKTRLFERSTRRVSLTPQGAAMIEPARRLLEIEAEVRRAARAASSGESGQVRVAYAGPSTIRVVSQLARRVRRDRPGISFELHTQNYAHSLMQRIVKDEVDIGFGRWEHLPPGVTSRVISHESLVMALPVSHPLAHEPGVHVGQFRHDSFVSLAPHSGAVLTDRLERMARAAGFLPEIVQIVPDAITAMAMVTAEIGISLTLSSVAENIADPEVKYVPVLDATLPVLLRMAWRTEHASNPAIRTVLELARDELPSLAGTND